VPSMRTSRSVDSVKVRVSYFARVRQFAGTREDEFTIARPACVRQLLSEVVSAHPGLVNIKEKLSLIVNGLEGGVSALEDTELKDGDEVVFLIPVGGG